MRHRSAVIAATASLVVLMPGAAFAHGGDDDAGPGAPGIGDPYFPLDGNGGYDVKHYDLDLRYHPAIDRLRGVATITARATQDLSRFNLDLVGLRIRSIHVDGERARWSREGHELTVRPDDSLDEGERFTVRIRYGGVPRTITDAFGASGFMHTDDGAIVAGQPHGAAYWFPANDHPRDAARFSLDITVPKGLEAISNGVLQDRDRHRGWTTWEWRATEPMAPYLATLAIGQYDLRRYEDGGIYFLDAFDPDLSTLDLDPESPDNPSAGEVARASLARQPEIIEFLEGFYGRYPFRAGGGIVDDHPEFAFALETQTRPIYSWLFFGDPIGGDLVVVHELAHQWLGDLLRIDTYQHIWLNEGFASYAEWLWLEREGLVTPQQIFDDLATFLPPDFWETTIGDPGPAVDQLFHPSVYLRGAMTLQALRQTVGDEAFFGILEQWVATQAGGTVTTDEFIALAEDVSGMQLDELFETWLFTPEKPAGLPEAPPPPPAGAAARAPLDRVTALLSGGPSRR